MSCKVAVFLVTYRALCLCLTGRSSAGVVSLCFGCYCLTYATLDSGSTVTVVCFGSMIEFSYLAVATLPSCKVGNFCSTRCICVEFFTCGALVVVVPACFCTGSGFAILFNTTGAGYVSERRFNYVFTNSTLLRIVLCCRESVGIVVCLFRLCATRTFLPMLGSVCCPLICVIVV